MSYSNQTEHYGLPQYIGTDKPTYLGDMNGAYATIDEKLYQAITNSNNAAESASEAAKNYATISETVSRNSTAITNLQSTQTSVNNNINTISGTSKSYETPFPNNAGFYTFASGGTQNIKADIFENDKIRTISVYGNARLIAAKDMWPNDLAGAIKISFPNLAQYLYQETDAKSLLFCNGAEITGKFYKENQVDRHENDQVINCNLLRENENPNNVKIQPVEGYSNFIKSGTYLWVQIHASVVIVK